MSIGGGHERLRRVVLERDGWVCQMKLPGCTTVATEANHIKHRAAGGLNAIWNYEAACRHCNAVDGGWVATARRRARRRHGFFGASISQDTCPGSLPPTPNEPGLSSQVLECHYCGASITLDDPHACVILV